MQKTGSRLRNAWVPIALLLLGACDSGSQTVEQNASSFKLPADLSALTETRLLDRDQLFAEIILRYEDVEERVTAARTPNTDVWQADFRLPGGHDYSIELTWFDTVDENRLDLVTFNRNFSAVFDSGPVDFDFNDYDFDGFDADDDGFVNLVERQNGTSPLVADDGTNNQVQLCQGGIVLPMNDICLEDAEPELALGFSALSLSAMPNETAGNTMVISNVGSAPLNYVALANQPWLRLVDDSNGNGVTGSLNPSASASLALEASCADNIEVRNGSISVQGTGESSGESDVLLVTLDCRGAILNVNPEFYQFAAEILPGTRQSVSDTMTLSNSGNEPLQFTLTSDRDWLCPINPDSGNCEQSLSGAVAAGEMLPLPIQGICEAAPQMLAGNLTVSSNGGTRIFPATINCTVAPFPELSLLPTQITFNSMQSQQASGDLAISNPGTATLEYNVSSNQQWLQIGNGQGAVAAGGSAAVPLQAQCGDAVEVLSGALLVTSNAGDATVPVTLDCAELPAPMLLLQTQAVTLAALFSQSAPAGVEITNTGSAPLNYSLSADRDWLQLSDTQGTLAIGQSLVLPLQAGCGNADELRSGSIQIASDGGNAALPVTLACTAPPQPQLALQTSQLSLTTLQNDAATSSIAFSNTGTAALSYTLGSDSSWLQLSGTEGTLPAGSNAAVPVSASCDNEVQTRGGFVNIITNAGNASVAVSLDCQAIPLPVLSVDTIELALGAEQNQQTAGVIAFANTGNAELGFSVVSDSVWLALMASGGTLAAGANTTVAFTAVCGEQVELRSGSVTFSSNGGGATVPVRLNCTAIPAPVLQVSGSPVALAAQQDATASGSFEIGNVGTAVLSYQIASDSDWLLASSSQTTLANGADTSVDVTGSCDGLVETRSGNITIASDGGNATVPVSLQCNANPLPFLSVQTESLTLQTQLGEAVPTNISIANSGNAELSFTASSSDPWILLALGQGTLAAGDTTLIPLSASCDDQVQTRLGTVTLDSDGGSADIPVTLICDALPQGILSVSIDSLALQALQGELATASFELSNTGNAVLEYNASSDSAWLELINAEGEIAQGAISVLAVNAQCSDVIELRTGSISIGSDGGDVQIPISLDCTAAPVAVLDVQPGLLTLVANIGESADDAITVQNVGTAPLTYTVASVGDWLLVDDANTGEPLELIAGEARELGVQANCGANLEELAGSVTINSTAGDATVPVSLDCRTPVLRVQPASLSFEAAIDGPSGGTARATPTIFNDGNAPLEVTVTSDSPWLCPDDSGVGSCASNPPSFSATVLPGELFSLVVLAECDDVDEIRTGAFNIESNAGAATLPVSLSCVFNGVPALMLTPDEFVETLDINTSGSALLAVENIGTAPLTYDISSDAPWLSISPNAGELAPGESASIDVEYLCESTPETRDGQLSVNWNLGPNTVPFSLTCMPIGSSGIAGSVIDAVNNVPLQGVQADLLLADTDIAQVLSDENGAIEFGALPAQQGYTLFLTLSGYIAENYFAIDTIEDDTTFLQTVLLVDEQFSGDGVISGTIVDAITGLGVEGLTLDFRRGINNRGEPVVDATTTDNNGQYTIAEMPAGNYTVEVNGDTHEAAFFNAIALGGQENNNQNATVSPLVLFGETRIVLTWGDTPFDLDSHLTGPIAGSSNRFHTYFADTGAQDSSPFAFLDLDDRSSFGPETITITQQFAGVYRYTAHDYSNRNSPDSTALSLSGARVQIIREGGLVAEFNVPNEAGTLWTVFEMTGDQITPINAMSFESDPFLIDSDDTGVGGDAQLIINGPLK